MLPMHLVVFLAPALQDGNVEEGSGRGWEVGSLHSHFAPWQIRPLGVCSVDVGAVEPAPSRANPEVLLRCRHHAAHWKAPPSWARTPRTQQSNT